MAGYDEGDRRHARDYRGQRPYWDGRGPTWDGDRRYGSREDYKRAYRAAFQQGYDEGYRGAGRQ